MEKKLLPYLVLISALSVSLSAAFYSVFGIGKLFSGASLQAMIMMSSLEIAKLVLASILYQYWNKLNIFLKTYYMAAVFILMALTSAGIYGYLSSAYSETSNKVENVDKKISVLDLKRSILDTQLNDIRNEKESINKNISDLTSGLSNNYIEIRGKDGKITKTTSSSNRKSFENQLTSAQKRRDEISLREVSISDSLSSIDMQKLSLETNSDLANEVGPLKYIAKLTGKTIDQVINWFIIALMVVFDPLAVSLVVGANMIFKNKNKEKEKRKFSEEIDQKIEDFKIREIEVKKIDKEIENRIKSIEDRESNISSREQEIENKIQQKEIDLQSFLESEKQKMDKILHERENEIVLKEEDLKLREEEYKKSEESKIQLKEEMKILEKTKSSIVIEKEMIEKEKESLKEREANLEKSKEELSNLDKEIKRWEATHWKMRRNAPPPSSI